jgi:hypothetical protein
MTAPELPRAAELRRAADLVGQGQAPHPGLLREAADELAEMARQLGEAKASLVVLEEQAGAYLEAVGLLRKARQFIARAFSPDELVIVSDIDRVLAVVRPAPRTGRAVMNAPKRPTHRRTHA